jgi:hypothetical protein
MRKEGGVMKHTINGETMKFGYKEMREFSESSGDVRVKIMMMRIEEHLRKLASSNDTINKLQNEILQLYAIINHRKA